MSERSSDLSLVTTRPIDPQLSHLWSRITGIWAERRLARATSRVFRIDCCHSPSHELNMARTEISVLLSGITRRDLRPYFSPFEFRYDRIDASISRSEGLFFVPSRWSISRKSPFN